jgi:hypothetical protein
MGNFGKSNPIMRKSATDIVQLFELMQSSQRRLFVSQALHSDALACLGKTQQVLEASRQLIERSDALVQRVRPFAANHPHHARSAALETKALPAPPPH